MNWKKKLKTWVDSGLISQAQAESILKFEDSKKIPYVFYSFLALGIVVIGLGVIAMVAANWDKIHYSIKLGTSFTILFGIGIAILYSQRKEIWNDTIRYLLVLLLGVLFFANIGLISQVYHTQGKLYQALLLWSGITILLVIMYPGRVLQHLWIAVFSSSILSWIDNNSNIDWRERSHYYSLFFFVASWVFAGVAIFAERRLETKESKTSILVNPFLLWAFGFFITSSIWGSFETRDIPNLDPNPEFYRKYDVPFPWYWPLIIPVTLIAISQIFRNRFSRRKIILLSISGIFLGFLNYPQLFHWYGKFPAMIFFFLAWIPFTFLFFESRRWFDLSLLVLGVRFVYIYLEVFGSLLATGIGLVVSGIFILGFSILIFKMRERIRNAANQLFQSEELGI
ncbi:MULTISPECIES: DUF2157 domain-containing protein [unclassified Leptospira]|uniref:DUF2157 domain-containing protein n=1 Tax=unclassified Leptospira TaxID=2633828 RepID=UPI0002BD6B9E|nr:MULTISPECIES: DUF2157 domain-containing protein [unclassified Leptospira]EMK01787.1 membrane protein, PF09925 family [Leptospira sp. B5-022]MCR1793482.1 DUF2157 domain-containing protein [Leptospira sp. id769339]